MRERLVNGFRGLTVGSLALLTIVVCGVTVRRLWSEVQKPVRGSISPIRSGREWQFVFIGSSKCGPSNRPELRAAVRRLLPALRREALAAGDQFSSLGIAVDWNVANGTEFLDRFAKFDELSIGRNWMNQGAIHLLWRDYPGLAMTPTVVLLTRTIVKQQDGLVVGIDSIVKRLSGVADILRYEAWLRGAPPPALADSLTVGTSLLGEPNISSVPGR